MPNCWGLIFFLLAYNAGAANVTLAWDASISSGVIEYVVKYGPAPGVYTSQESAGLSLSTIISDLPDGFRYYFTVIAKTALDDSEDSNEVSFRQSFSNAPMRIILQAEFAILEPPFVVMTDSSAMTGGYASPTNNEDGLCTFRLNAPFRDEYVIWARVLSPNEGTDSFYVALNDEPEDVYDTVLARTNVWQWTMVNGRGGINKPVESAHAIDPRFFIMSGLNLIKFRGREQGTGLDAIMVTNDRSLRPKAPDSPTLQLTVER